VKFLVDTNVISELRRGERAHPNVVRWVEGTDPREMGTSVLVLAAIRRGIELKRRRDVDQAEALDRWFDRMRERLEDRVAPVDQAIAGTWAVMSVQRTVPLLDGLLAATARLRGLILVTRNTAAMAGMGVPLLDPFEAPLG
jgi:toxin FitB